MGLSTLRTLRALGVIFSLFALLLLSSCEEADKNSIVDQPAEPEGIVQAKVENGQSYVALALAPKEPGREAPDLSAWKGRDLFAVGQSSASDQDPRARGIITAPTINPNVGYIYTSVGTWRLRDRRLQVLTGSLNGGFANDAGGRISTSYLSDDCVYWTRTYDLSGEKRQKLSVEHDKLKGVAEIYWRNGIIYAEVNGGPPLFAGRISESYLTNVNLTLILPLEGGLAENGMPNDLLAEYVGVWTVKAEPEVAPFPGSAEGGTPFTFSLRSLIVEEIEAVKRDDLVNPQTQAKESAGATFTAVAKMNRATALDPNLDGAYYRENGRTLYWRADVFPERNPRDQIRRFTGDAPFVASGTQINIDWDGLSNAGARQPGDTNYGIAITAVVGPSGQDPNNALGEIVTVTPGAGPPEIIHDDVKLELSPDPYIPYTAEELVYSFDADGNPVWPDDDGDGQPDRFPDHNHDGVPDLQPGESPPPLKISAKISKLGYKTSWYLEVLDEKGDPVGSDPSSPGYPPGPPPWSGDNDVDLEWRYPRADLDPQKLKFVLTVTRCRNEPNVQILGQTTTPTIGCPSFKLDGEIAYGEGQPVLEVLAGGASGGEDSMLALGFEDGNANVSENARELRSLLLGQVHRIGPAETQKSVLFKAEGIYVKDSDGKPIQTLVAEVRGLPEIENNLAGNETDPAAQVALSRTGDGVYESQPFQLSTAMTGSGQGPRSYKTTISVGEVLDPTGVLTAVLQLFVPDGLDMGPRHPRPICALGRYQETAFKKNWLTESGNTSDPFPPINPETHLEAPPLRDNLAAMGFEPVEVKLTAGDAEIASGTLPEIKAVLKASRAPDIVFWNFHGTHVGSLLPSEEIDRRSDFPDKLSLTIDPGDLVKPGESNNLSRVRVLGLLACEALDVNNYNEIFPETLLNASGQEVVATAQQRYYGGEIWDKATGNGNTVLLGYNGPVPKRYIQTVMESYADELDRLSGAVGEGTGQIPASELEAMAWMSANETIARQEIDDGDLRRLYFQASAITGMGYYYFPFEYATDPISEGFRTPMPPEFPGLVYRVDRAKWNEQPAGWKSNRDNRKITTPVKIPGV